MLFRKIQNKDLRKMEESVNIHNKSQLCNNESPTKSKLIRSQAQVKGTNDQNDGEFVFTDLNQINPIILLKRPKAYRECFEQLFKMAGEHLQNQNYETSIKFYEKSLQLVDIGKNIINKEAFAELQYMKIVVFGNLACGYLNTRKLQKCNKYCEKAIEEIEKFLTSAEKEVFLKISITLMVLKFQNCAILSQLQQHQRSLELCRSNLSLIKKYLQILDLFVRQSLRASYQKRKSNQTVHFSRQVYKFALVTIKQLLEYIQEPMLKKQEMVFYYWEKNPEKNEEQLLKKFIPMENENCKRSILGVSKKNHWIDEFNIGSVMHMTPLKIQELKNTFPIEQYVFKDKLYEIAIYCSMCYFTMATQTRFIDSNMKALSGAQNPGNSSAIYKQESEESIKKVQNIGNLKIMKKYGYSQKSEMYKRSQVYHLCSIDVMSRVVKYAIPYINHIIKSYEKHYIKQKKLEQIMAIFQQSFQEQDTIVNQSIAEYMPYENLTVDRNNNMKIEEFDNMESVKMMKNNHVLDVDTDDREFELIIEGEQQGKENSEQNSGRAAQDEIQNSQEMNETSGEQLQSVVKKKKSLRNSRHKIQKSPGPNLRSSRNNPHILDDKEQKQIKKKINSQKSPTHALGNPPKPPMKKKKA